MASRLIPSGARIPPLPTVRDLIKLYKLRALKHLSQNFLLDERLTDKIVRAAGRIEGHHVLEVGPGPGSITRSIIRRMPKELIVVEKDARFMPTLNLLAEACAKTTQMEVVHDDILMYRIDGAFHNCPPTEWEGPRAPVHLIGNLPFSISTRLLINWLKDISLRRGAWSYGRASLTLTFQKEVADRIVAPMGADDRCRLSVMSQIWTRPELRFCISGRAFIPPPDVDVGVVTLVPFKEPLTTLDFDLVEKVVRHLFSTRKKYILRGIETLFPPEHREELTNRVVREAQVQDTFRAFKLSVDECLRIAHAYHDIVQEDPEIYRYNYRARKIRSKQLNLGDDEGPVDDGEEQEIYGNM